MKPVEGGLQAACAGLDWAGLMAAGIGGLQLDPTRFWALSPLELRLMLGIDQHAPARLARMDLEALLVAFPDQPAPSA